MQDEDVLSALKCAITMTNLYLTMCDENQIEVELELVYHDGVGRDAKWVRIGRIRKVIDIS